MSETWNKSAGTWEKAAIKGHSLNLDGTEWTWMAGKLSFPYSIYLERYFYKKEIAALYKGSISNFGS